MLKKSGPNIDLYGIPVLFSNIFDDSKYKLRIAIYLFGSLLIALNECQLCHSVQV